MKLTILVDNNTYIDQYYLGEPALSFLIEDEEEKILFDTGYSDAFMHNAKLMGIELSDLSAAVISHGHIDHTGGLPYLAKRFDTKKLPLYAHPEAFDEKRLDGLNTGAPLRKEQLAEKFDLRLSKEHVCITPKLLFLGQIPQYFDFEPRVMTGEVQSGDHFKPDYDMDDSAIVYTGKDGLFIITGCSHSGICNIIRHAQVLTGTERIAGVVGGFHLFKDDQRLEATIDYLESLSIPSLNPCHCVSLFARAAMLRKLKISETGTGMVLYAD